MQIGLGIPCGFCDMCKHPDRFTQVSVSRARGCIYSCRVAMPVHEWCKVCHKERNRPTVGLENCKLRIDIMLGSRAATNGTPQTFDLSRTRSVIAAVEATAAGSDGMMVEIADAVEITNGNDAGTPHMRLTFDDLDKDKAPEHAILGEAKIALVIVTANAIVSSSQRGRLLRDALVLRGIRRDHFDEIDQVHDHAMAAYNQEIAGIGRVRNVIATRLAGRGQARPQRYGYTATLAPSCQAEVLRRAGFVRDTIVVRASIDRPELAYARVPVASLEGETLAQLVVRSVLLVLDHAPTWATGGRIVINCTLTLNCLRIAALLRAHGFSAHAYTTNNMTDSCRALSLAAFAANPTAILVPSEAWGQGVSVPGIHLIINAALKSNPVTGAQHDGRAAREAGERGLIVTILNGRLTAERLRLADPSKRGNTVGPTLLLGQLCARGCMRDLALRYLGGCIDGACTGCDDCVRRGAGCALLQPVGRLHDLSLWVPAKEAAVHLLCWMCERDNEPLSQTEVRSAPPPDAPPPFDSLAAHERLIDTLIARGGLRVEGLPFRHGHGGFVLLAVDLRVKQQLEFGGESLYVLLAVDREDAKGTRYAGGDCVAAEEAEEESEMPAVEKDAEAAAVVRRAEARAQRFHEQYAVGVAGLLACSEIMREQLSDALPLVALRTTDAQRTLVLAAESSGQPYLPPALPQVGLDAPSPAPFLPAQSMNTPTIGSVRPVLQRNLFGVPPSPPRAPHPTGSPERSPRSSRLSRLATMMVGGTKRAAAGSSSPSMLDSISSPAAPVTVTERGSPMGVSSESRRRPKRRPVVGSEQ